MASAFPQALDSFSLKVDGVDEILAAHVNGLQDSVVALETYARGYPFGQNLLYHSLCHDIWPQGTTLNDMADDTYCAGVWNVVSSANTPDISGQAGGSTDPFTRYFRCTMDAASQLAGLVQFLTAEDTRKLRGSTVSLSYEAWGTSITELRAAVIYWTGTADAITSDVVVTWVTGNQTLATNWAYANTPAADVTISSSRARFKVEGISIPTDANNIGVFIWTPNAESSGDLFNIANVKLEVGPIATPFSTPGLAEEMARVRYFIRAFDASSNAVSIGLGAKIATTHIYINLTLTPMFRVPTLVHNVTGYTASAPGTTTIGAVDLTTNTFFTITGALTFSLSGANKEFATLQLIAGTSWSGTAGDLAVLRIGPDVVMYLDARL